MNKRETLEAALRGEGCLGKAADDEPVFVLRAQDQLFPTVVRIWAELANLFGSPDAKVDGAVADAEAGDDWQAGHFHKVPD